MVNSDALEALVSAISEAKPALRELGTDTENAVRYRRAAYNILKARNVLIDLLGKGDDLSEIKATLPKVGRKPGTKIAAKIVPSKAKKPIAVSDDEDDE